MFGSKLAWNFGEPGIRLPADIRATDVYKSCVGVTGSSITCGGCGETSNATRERTGESEPDDHATHPSPSNLWIVVKRKGRKALWWYLHWPLIQLNWTKDWSESWRRHCSLTFIWSATVAVVTWWRWTELVYVKPWAVPHADVVRLPTTSQPAEANLPWDDSLLCAGVRPVQPASGMATAPVPW